MKSVCCDTRLIFLFCSDSKSSGFSLAGVSFSLHLLKAVQSLTFHGFRNTISVLNLFSVYSPLFFVPLLTLNSKAPYPCLFSSDYSIFLESNCSSFSLVISGLNWERFPTVWLALGGDIETASDQNHAAAETGKLHSNLFLPKVVCSAFSWKYGSLVSGSHISPNISTWSCTHRHAFFWWNGVCAMWTFPSLCLTNLNFFGYSATGRNSWEFLLQRWFLNSQEFSTYCLSILYSCQWRECQQVWENAASWTIFYQE